MLYKNTTNCKTHLSLKEHVNFLNVAYMIRERIPPPTEAAEKAKKYQREYMEEKLKARRN